MPINMKKSFLFMLFAAFTVNASATPQSTQIAEEYNQLKKKTTDGKTVRVIVKVKGTEKQKLRKKKAATRAKLLRGNKQKHDGLKSHLSRQNIKLNREFPRLGYMTLEVNNTQLDELIESGLVDSITEEPVVYPTLDDSVSLIGAHVAHSVGYGGAGQAVAILDTGVESSHVAFGGRVVEEACFSTTSGSYTSLCPNGLSEVIAVGAAEPCESACYHGTHVAAIAAGVNGVAPEADIVAIQGFSLNEETGKVAGQWGDLLASLEWVLQEANTQNIAAINMSLGNDVEYLTACDTNILAGTIEDLRAAGIATVISSGNSAFNNGVGAPACISDAITVGNTTKSDVLAWGSNSSELVDLLAPGTSIYAAVPGGSYAYLSGTSMAAPHVSGAFAVLRSAKPSASVTEIELSLENTGVDVTDSDNGVTKPRIVVNDAIIALTSAVSEPTLLWPNGTDPVASSEQSTNPAVNVGDENLSTRWSAQNVGETITFDLGDVYNVSALKIAFHNGDSRHTYFNWEVSTDGVNFTTVLSDVESSGSTTSLETFTQSTEARYVRIVGLGNSSNNWNSLSEVQVWGASTNVDADTMSVSELDTFSAATNSQTLNITSNVDWFITSNDEWITINTPAGSGNGSTTIEVSENSITDIREGTITVTAGLFSKTINVVQEAAEPEVLAPINLTVEVTGTGEITLDWDDSNNNETGYKIEYARYHEGESSHYTFSEKIITAHSTSYVLTGLLEDWYYVQVSAISDDYVSEPAVVEWTYVKFDGVELDTPENFSVTVTAEGELTLTWADNNTEETNYLVEYARWYEDDENLHYPFVPVTLPADSTSYVITGLASDWYYVRVSATAGDVSSDYAYDMWVEVQFTDDMLDLSTSSLTFEANGGSQDVTISSNISWSVSDNASWLTAGVTNGTNNANVTFTAEENTISASRTATITVWGEAFTKYITVTQAGVEADNEIVIIEPPYVYASSDDGNVADNVFDDDLTTRWSANGLGENLTIFLGDLYTLTEIQVAYFKGDQRQTSIKVEVSLNTTVWTEVYNGTSSGDTVSLEEVYTGSIDARYVRITGFGNTSNTWNSITEVQFKGSL